MDCSSQSFRFLDLPKDIRLMVYERLPRRVKHHHVAFSSALPRCDLAMSIITKAVPTAILATCRQVNEEAKVFVAKILQEFILEDGPKLILANAWGTRLLGAMLDVFTNAMNPENRQSVEELTIRRFETTPTQFGSLCIFREGVAVVDKYYVQFVIRRSIKQWLRQHLHKNRPDIPGYRQKPTALSIRTILQIKYQYPEHKDGYDYQELYRSIYYLRTRLQGGKIWALEQQCPRPYCGKLWRSCFVDDCNKWWNSQGVHTDYISSDEWADWME